jgi:hypothetical protein
VLDAARTGSVERELHERMMEAERDVVASEMAKLDVDAPAILIDGKVHRRVLRQSQTYETSAGEVVVERTLYKDRADEDGRCAGPMDLVLGVVGDFWTPRAAQQALCELGYFRKHKKRMNYAELKAQGFMIGSGVVEAACKTLVTQRLKQSGMRWSVPGAQAVLTPRGWDQSEGFDKAWALVAATFQAHVTVLANVIALKPQSALPKPRVKASR